MICDWQLLSRLADRNLKSKCFIITNIEWHIPNVVMAHLFENAWLLPNHWPLQREEGTSRTNQSRYEGFSHRTPQWDPKQGHSQFFQHSSKRCAKKTCPVWYSKGGDLILTTQRFLSINMWQQPRQNRNRQREAAEAMSLSHLSAGMEPVCGLRVVGDSPVVLLVGMLEDPGGGWC